MMEYYVVLRWLTIINLSQSQNTVTELRQAVKGKAIMFMNSVVKGIYFVHTSPKGKYHVNFNFNISMT